MIDSLLEDADGDAPLLRLQSFRPTQPRKLLECKVRCVYAVCVVVVELRGCMACSGWGAMTPA